MKYLNKLTLIFVLVFSMTQAQEQLTKEKAVALALDNNYGIRIAKNQIKVAKNNAGIYNSGYLPRVTGNAGAVYSNTDSERTSQNGTRTETNGAISKTYNASLGLNYTLFDGFGRAYNYKKLKEAYNLSELEAQAIIENSLLQVFTFYYEVARLTEESDNIATSLNISKQRLTRAQYGFEYGQNTKLQLLNAEVDINNDSIRYINTQRFLANAKRDLNLLLGRNVTTDFSVDTQLIFNRLFDLQDLLEKAESHNIEMQKINKNLLISDFNIKISKAGLLPSLSLNSSYGFNKSDNDATYLYTEQFSKGLNAGISLNWNIFDGGTTKTNIQNSKIYAESLQVEKELVSNELERDVANALEVYNNALFVMKSEDKNVETNERNFSRTVEQFKLGQVSSIEFRQAQVNLLNAQSGLNQAKYDAKNAELRLLQLTGALMTADF